MVAAFSLREQPERGDYLSEEQGHIYDHVCVEDELAEGLVELRAELPSHEDESEDAEQEMRAHADNVEWEEFFDDLFEIEYQSNKPDY